MGQSSCIRQGENFMTKRLPYLIALLFTVAFTSSLRASPPIGAVVQGSRYDPVKGTMTFSVLNISHKDITAFSLQLRETYSDGTGGTSESMTDFLPSMISIIEQGHPITQDNGNGAFAPGATHNQEFPQSQTVQKFSATVDMVAYADGTADVLNEAAFKQLVLQRKARVLAMQKANELLMNALADPKDNHPSITVAAQLKGLANALHNKKLTADDPEIYEGLGLLMASRDVENAPQSSTRNAKEDDYLRALIKTHGNRVSRFLPHTELTRGVQP
jgi:hypothetical protein